MNQTQSLHIKLLCHA